MRQPCRLRCCALMLWGVASAAWSASATQPLLQSQRTLTYAAAAFAALALVRARSYRPATRGRLRRDLARLLLQPRDAALPEPDRLDRLDRRLPPRGADRLLERARHLRRARHLLAVGFAGRRGRSPALRALAAAAIVVLVPTLYFTYSRGAWAALAPGLVTMVVLDPRRLQLSTTLAVVALWPALAVWRASGSAPLAGPASRGSAAATEHAGHRFALYVGVLALAALRPGIYALLERARSRPPPRCASATSSCSCWASSQPVPLVPVRYGSPATIARHGYDSFMSQAGPLRNGDLNSRLFTFSAGDGRIPQWKVAWREYRAHPWLGSGAGELRALLGRVPPDGVRGAKRPQPLPRDARRARARRARAAARRARGAAHRRDPRAAADARSCGGGGLRRLSRPRGRRLGLAAARRHARRPLLRHRGSLLAARSIEAEARFLPRLPGSATGCSGRPSLLGALAFVGLRGNQAVAASERAAAKLRGCGRPRPARRARRASGRPGRRQPLAAPRRGTGRRSGSGRPRRRASATRSRENRQDWTIWLDLAVVSQRRRAESGLAAARRLRSSQPRDRLLAAGLLDDALRRVLCAEIGKGPGPPRPYRRWGEPALWCSEGGFGRWGVSLGRYRELEARLRRHRSQPEASFVHALADGVGFRGKLCRRAAPLRGRGDGGSRGFGSRSSWRSSGRRLLRALRPAGSASPPRARTTPFTSCVR